MVFSFPFYLAIAMWKKNPHNQKPYHEKRLALVALLWCYWLLYGVVFVRDFMGLQYLEK